MKEHSNTGAREREWEQRYRELKYVHIFPALFCVAYAYVSFPSPVAAAEPNHVTKSGSHVNQLPPTGSADKLPPYRSEGELLPTVASDP